MQINGRLNKNKPHIQQTGAALITSMLILLVMTIIAITSMGSSTLEEKISSNYKSHKQAFFNAEAGILLAIKQLTNFNTTTINNSYQDVTITPKTSGGSPVTWYDNSGTGNYSFSLNSVSLSNLNNYVYKITSTGKSNNSTYRVVAEVTRPNFITIPATLYGLFETRVVDSATLQGRDVCAQPVWPPMPPTTPPTTPIGLPSAALYSSGGDFIVGPSATAQGVMLGSGTPPVPTFIAVPSIPVPSHVNNYGGMGTKGAAVAGYINTFSSLPSARSFNVPPGTKAIDVAFDSPNSDGSCTDSNLDSTDLGGTAATTTDGKTDNVVVITIQAGDTLELKNLKGCGVLIIKGNGTGKVEFKNNGPNASTWNGLILTTEQIEVEDNTQIRGSILSNFRINPSASGNNEFKDTSNTSFCQAALNPILKSYLPPPEIISWRGNSL